MAYINALLFRESKWWSFFCAERTDYFLSGTYDRDNHACPLYPFVYGCVRFYSLDSLSEC